MSQPSSSTLGSTSMSSSWDGDVGVTVLVVMRPCGHCLMGLVLVVGGDVAMWCVVCSQVSVSVLVEKVSRKKRLNL